MTRAAAPPDAGPGLRQVAYQRGADRPVHSHRCTWCGYVYDPARGDPDRGIAPGTPFAELPETWCCPDCRAPTADFEPVAAEAAGGSV